MSVNARLSDLEIEISELKDALLLNEDDILHKNANEWARRDSNSRSPPCKGSVWESEPVRSCRMEIAPRFRVASNEENDAGHYARIICCIILPSSSNVIAGLISTVCQLCIAAIAGSIP